MNFGLGPNVHIGLGVLMCCQCIRLYHGLGIVVIFGHGGNNEKTYENRYL